MRKLFFILLLTNSFIFADSSSINESVIIFKPNTTVSSAPVLNAVPTKTANLDSADNAAQNVIELNRQIDLAKKRAELRKLNDQNSGSGILPGSSSSAGGQRQTVVTGVAIDVDGKKFATLQFTDGGTLDVSIGSRVGEYVVTDIKMTGVTLKNMTNKNKLYLKRSYSLAIKPQQQNNQQATSSIFTPSPVITSANSGDDNNGTLIPPILPIRQ